MRAVLTNFGTTGDIYPLLALALELQRHGHQPILALSPSFAPLIKRMQVGFIPLGPDLRALQQEINALIVSGSASAERLDELLEPLGGAMLSAYAQLQVICADADMLISGTWQPSSYAVYESTRIPFVSIQLGFSYNSRQRPPVFQTVMTRLVNNFRTQVGLTPLSNPMDAHSPQLALLAWSRHLSPALTSWGANYHQTGFFYLEDEDWQPPADLRAFFAADNPPIAITFGNAQQGAAAGLFELLIDAVERAGCRAIIQQTSEEPTALRPPTASVYFAGYIPHRWLFSRVRCVVHHGGAGTTAAVARAGTPSVVVPHGWDQPAWAAFVHGLGCAGPPIPYQHLTAERLAHALVQTLSTPRYAQASAALSEQLRAEQGVQKARQLIERLADQLGLDQAYAAERRDVDLIDDREEKIWRRKQYQQQQRARKA